MNRRILSGSLCLFRLNPAGSRNGRIVLAQLSDSVDPEMGGRYTVKVYESVREHSFDGTWRHKRVLLKPDSTDPSFQPIVLEDVPEGEIVVLAEMVEVLG